MTLKEIVERVELAIRELIENEGGNLRRDLNELNVSTYLAFYLKPYFTNYDVDPEYNGDVDKPNDRKALDIARNRIKEVRQKPNAQNNYRLSPDIIIHKRESNDNNLVVIEVKKDSHPTHLKDFDLIKLEHLTINYLGNHYNYDMGIALILGTKGNVGNYEMKFFVEGNPIRRDLINEM
ncbi:hypothetical protein [uncultured Draconibacterium sp.]|uniref:hypothetical protein n=1 Tax=uncultured Draconibacterium sp. TaxID=1573823 RepID=UPI0029C64646|nr:hypothetical protein [uncultured Draconibacterium sp.]